MTDVVNTWVMKSVNPPKAGWYFTWSEHNEELVYPRYYSENGKWAVPIPGGDGFLFFADENFDMWCRQPVPPDVNAYHQLRAIMAAKNN